MRMIVAQKCRAAYCLNEERNCQFKVSSSDLRNSLLEKRDLFQGNGSFASSEPKFFVILRNYEYDDSLGEFDDEDTARWVILLLSRFMAGVRTQYDNGSVFYIPDPDGRSDVYGPDSISLEDFSKISPYRSPEAIEAEEGRR